MSNIPRAHVVYHQHGGKITNHTNSNVTIGPKTNNYNGPVCKSQYIINDSSHV